MPSTPLTLISSMATQKLLAELLAQHQRDHPESAAALESVGGVDAARRVQSGEHFDGVLLASDAIDKLIASGHVLAGSRVDWVRSGVAVAVPQSAPQPDIGSEAAVQQAVRQARTLSYSTGPSGVQLARLFDQWGMAEQVKAKLVIPPPGTPVGQLVAGGEVELGFQQLSELMHLPGIDVVGPLPEAIQITTVFSGGVAATSQQPGATRALLAFLAAAHNADTKLRHGMAPA